MIQTSAVRRVVGMVLLFMVCLVLPACGKNRVTKANFDKIKVGMSLSEVEAILGKGKKEEQAGTAAANKFTGAIGVQGKLPDQDIYVWESGVKTITVIFVNGKVSVDPIQSGLE
jgi:hypothetical protein